MITFSHSDKLSATGTEASQHKESTKRLLHPCVMNHTRLLIIFFVVALFAIVWSQTTNGTIDGTTEKPTCKDVLESCDLFKEFCGEPSWTSLEGHCDKTCGFCEPDTSS